MPDRTEEPFPWDEVPMRGMTDEEIEAAALADPDAQPLTPEQFARARPVSKIKRLRWSLGLSQEAFAARFGLSLATLRDWEQGRSQPDQAASTYLDMIARAPETIMHLLALPPDQAAGR